MKNPISNTISYVDVPGGVARKGISHVRFWGILTKAGIPCCGISETSPSHGSGEIHLDPATSEGHRFIEGLQLDTVSVLRALLASGEKLTDDAMEYLQATLKERDTAQKQAEAQAEKDALFKRVRVAGEKVAQGRRDGEKGKGWGHDAMAYCDLMKKYKISSIKIAEEFLKGANQPITDDKLRAEASNIRALASKKRKGVVL